MLKQKFVLTGYLNFSAWGYFEVDFLIEKLLTRMHSSRMCTAHLLTTSCSICCGMHAPLPCMPSPPPAMHAPCHTQSPATHAPSNSHACPPSCMSPTMHVPPAMHSPLPHTPCHAFPPGMHALPTMHAPLPCTAPHHTCPLPHTLPCHTSPCHACPPATHAPPLWTEFLKHASENITLCHLRCGP